MEYEDPIINPSLKLKSRNEEMARLSGKCSENVTANTLRNGPKISDENINDTWRGDASLTPKIVVN